MKKIISLALASLLLVGASAQTSEASKFNISGILMLTGEGQFTDFLAEGDLESSLKFIQRVDTTLSATISEEVKAAVRVRVPNKGQFGQLANADTQVQLRAAFLDFPVAMLNVRAGVQSYNLPGYLGSGVNPVLASPFPVSGFLVKSDFGVVAPELGWFVTEYPTTGSTRNLFTLTLPIGLGDGLKLTPWVAHDSKNTGAGVGSDTYIGATFDANVNKINAGIGGIFTMTDTDSDAIGSNILVSAHAKVDLGIMTPGVAFWYGIDDNGASGIGKGTWGWFNGINETYWVGGVHSLSTTGAHGQYSYLAGKNGPFGSLGVVVSTGRIGITNTFGINPHVIYLMDTTEADTRTPEVLFGATFSVGIAKGLMFLLDADFVMQMADEAKGKPDAKLGSSIAGTFTAAF